MQYKVVKNSSIYQKIIYEFFVQPIKYTTRILKNEEFFIIKNYPQLKGPSNWTRTIQVRIDRGGQAYLKVVTGGGAKHFWRQKWKAELYLSASVRRGLRFSELEGGGDEG